MHYKVLKKKVFTLGNFSIVPIRFEDKLNIMEWRNEQMYHLRQDTPLTIKDQEDYFENVVSEQFTQDKPNQILFSFLNGDRCIGYGGLVHINWIDKNAEISFIMETQLEKDHFEEYWSIYLGLIEQVAFDSLNLHKIFTYAFDLRPKLYLALEKIGFSKEAILKDHCLFEGVYLDVIIHSKIKNSFQLKIATKDDFQSTFNWVNNKTIRKFSFNQKRVLLSDHKKWFFNKISSFDCLYLIAYNNNEKIGSIRFDLSNDFAVLSYLIDTNHQGKGYGTLILEKGIDKLKFLHNNINVVSGFVMEENTASIHIFKKLNFDFKKISENLKFSKNI